jgi:hypothetical protein
MVVVPSRDRMRIQTNTRKMASGVGLPGAGEAGDGRI